MLSDHFEFHYPISPPPSVLCHKSIVNAPATGYSSRMAALSSNMVMHYGLHGVLAGGWGTLCPISEKAVIHDIVSNQGAHMIF